MSVPEAVWNEIKALKQEHAELAAKVEHLQQTSSTYTATVDDALTKQFIELSLRVGELESKFRVSDDVTDRRIAALESPAPAPDTVCANSDCGHSEDLHTHPAFGLGFCLRCPCPDYVPTAEPAPLDPVLVAIRDLYLIVVPNRNEGPSSPIEMGLRDEFGRRTGTGPGWVTIDAAIRAYGRDGAR